jgi:hypothetical protein
MITHAKAVRGSNVGKRQVRFSIVQCRLVATVRGKQGQDCHANAIRGHGKMQVNDGM